MRSKGVLTSLEDGENVISFLEQNRKLLNLKTKIRSLGVSAGAGISLWNGFKDNKFERISGILAIEAQSSYNVYTWEKVFNGFNIDEMRKLYSELDEIYLNFIKVNQMENYRKTGLFVEDGQNGSTFLHFK